ncbi:hypothetical protein L249_6582 [Ophiocordyceps polyrhachis-furcata BCC 54312]|uniref:Uncharacterized protein n=1 Tax=Ophiocordyceps polyrhachis-furcata BCC 54312 TaxID=1330021 RepID=A0A367LJE9_9HYPO|nr:hypothetical protein L249_6582 [Ophiocordyceps polyrhachis-furcata BCC 54312]
MKMRHVFKLTCLHSYDFFLFSREDTPFFPYQPSNTSIHIITTDQTRPQTDTSISAALLPEMNYRILSFISTIFIPFHPFWKFQNRFVACGTPLFPPPSSRLIFDKQLEFALYLSLYSSRGFEL